MPPSKSTKIRRYIRTFLQKHFVITGVLTFLFSGLVFYVLLVIPGEVYAAYRYDENVVRTQVLLSLSGYKLDPREIDGKLGPVTESAIKDYQKKKGFTPTGKVTEELYKNLYDDTKLLFSQSEFRTDGNNNNVEQGIIDKNSISSISSELDQTKESLKKTNDTVKSLVDNMQYHFITSYRDLVEVVGTSLGIVAGLLAALLAWGIPRLQSKITEDVKNAHEEMLEKAEIAHKDMLDLTENRVFSNVLTNFSATCLYLYCNLDKQKNIEQYNSYLDMTISIANLAYDKAIKLNRNHNLTEEDIKVIDCCFNNKIYYLIERGRDEDKEEVKKLLDHFEEITRRQENDPYNKNWWYTKETLLWAKFKVGLETKENSEIAIKSLLKNVDNSEWKSYILKKWNIDKNLPYS